MKVYAFNNIHRFHSPINTDKIQNNNSFIYNISGDIVSFSAKKYSSSDIIYPTNHCAYCGCKVYSEYQIEALAKEILNSKAERLEGKIKSIIEKLEEAKHAQDIALAKRLENQEEIDFFNKLSDISSKKSFLKGEAIFENVYHLDREHAIELLIKNMRPLQRTIDHVSPKHEDKENKNSDVNLVEACYCCNHDLKKGSSFSEFYIMFPSIKNNMPKEKFDYAVSQILESSSNQITKRLSASNMLKFLERLFIQRSETSNYLDSIDFRIKDCESGICDIIQSCKDEIAEKESEISELQKKFDELKQDPEFTALLDRISINSKINSMNNVISSLRNRKDKASSSINELRNPPKTKKNQEKLSEEEKEEKINNLKALLEALQSQIDTKEEVLLELQIKLEELDKKYPLIENLQLQKRRAESVYNAHINMEQTRILISKKQEDFKQLTERELDLSSQIADILENCSVSSEFKPESYPDSQRASFFRYKELTEALAYLNDHPNGGNVKILINKAAKLQIESELNDLQEEEIIIDFNKFSYMKILEKELENVKKEKEACKKVLEKMEQECKSYEALSSSMSIQDAQLKIKELSETIKRITEKQNYVEIPHRIITLKTEITLLNQTISDLESKHAEIDSMYSYNA